MNKFKITILLFTIVLLISSPGVRAENSPGKDQLRAAEPERKPIRHVLFITMDNANDEALKSAYTPNINGLAASGIRTSAIGVLPANSAPYIASLFTGADPSVHGLVDDKKQLKTLTFPQIVGMYGRPAVFVSQAGSTPAAVIGRGENAVENIQIKTKSNEVLIEKAIEIFNQKQPYFLGLRMIGSQGSKTERAKAINATDEQIGRLLAALRTKGIYDQCLVVAAGNYGEMDNLFKKYARIEDLMVPVIMNGPGLKNGAFLPPVKITDIAPTVALLTGIQISPESSGNVLWNALKSGTGFIEENLLLKRVKDLSEDNIKSIGAMYRLNEETGLVKIEKENTAREKANIQKTVEGKNAQIKTLKREITILRFVEAITIAVMGLGYAVEYFYLRKKFLMF